MLACGGSFGVALFGQGRTGANETRTETSRSLLALPTATPIRLQSQSGQVVQLQSDVVDDPAVCLAVDRGVDPRPTRAMSARDSTMAVTFA